MKTVALFLGLVLSVASASCNEGDEATQNTPKQPVRELPAVTSSGPVSQSVLAELRIHSSLNARMEQIYDLNTAQAATYAGYEDLEFVYLPYLDKNNSTAVYQQANGKLLEDFSFDFTRTDESFIIDFGNNNKVIYQTEGDIVKDVEVMRGNIPNARVASGDPFKDYLDCISAPGQQFGDLICSGCGFGEWSFNILCSYWAVCGGSITVMCTAYVASRMGYTGQTGYIYNNSNRR